MLVSAASTLGPPAAWALEGTTIDYSWDGRGDHPRRAWSARAYLPAGATAPPDAPTRPVGLVVFLHGLNKRLVKYRWMGSGPEDDLRALLDTWVAAGAMPPFVLAAPSSVVASEVSRGSSWRGFDLDRFVTITRRVLHGRAQIDPERVIVAGHSGAGCSLTGGLATVDAAETPLHALLAIDTCLTGALARRWAGASPETHVVVAYQKLGWPRAFDAFASAFRAAAPSPGGFGLRHIDVQHPAEDVHNATVPLSFTRWLPRLLGSAPLVDPSPPVAPAGTATSVGSP